MVEMRRLKNVVVFIQTILNFVLSRIIINTTILHRNMDIYSKRFSKIWKTRVQKNKVKLDIDHINNCKKLGVYPKFLIFKLPNVSNKVTLSFRKRLLRSAINKRNK